MTAALLLATSASAQRYSNQAPEGEYSPTVYLISVQETENIGCGCAAQEAIARNRAAVNNAIKDYDETHRYGFQQAAKPQFVFTTKDNRFSLALGGSVTLRAGYDFNGIFGQHRLRTLRHSDSGRLHNTRQKLMMDASTSRVFLKSITNSGVLGRVIVFMDADFRGGREGSYTPRLRSAYVSLGGFTLGRDVTTFCDLQAAPMTDRFPGSQRL